MRAPRKARAPSAPGALLLAAPLALALAPRMASADAVSARWLDAQGKAVDLALAGLEPVRTPPAASPAPGENFFRLLLVGPASSLPSSVDLRSEHASGGALDQLPSVELGEASCPDGVSPRMACRATPPLRMAIDREDRQHPASSARSIQAELGGRVAASVAGNDLLAARVAGPALPGSPRWTRARLRVFLVRDRPHGAPPFGFSDAMATNLTRAQIGRANAIWGQCGVSFGPPDQVDLRLVDPPGPVLLAVGCNTGARASGGTLRVRVDGRDLSVTTAPGDTPASAARKLAIAAAAEKLSPELSDNLRADNAALPTTDLLLRRRDRGLALIDPLRTSSSDPTLPLCVGAVDLSDGLQHFVDVDAVDGTLEERTLLRTLDDGDPRTIEVVLIPSFATGGRIGESFILGDHGSLPNMIIEDRAGIRADTVSFALAHELGHVLLDVPGHSDDFGVDTPTRLMDSDAADPSPFGPRRLTLAECERVARQSGPRSPAPLLSPWAPPPPRPEDLRKKAPRPGR